MQFAFTHTLQVKNLNENNQSGGETGTFQEKSVDVMATDALLLASPGYMYQ